MTKDNKRFNKYLCISAVASLVLFTNFQDPVYSYSSVADAINTSGDREYTLIQKEVVNSNLGTVYGKLTIDGGSETKYGIKSSSKKGMFVDSSSTLILKNIGSAQINIETGDVSSYSRGIETFRHNWGGAIENAGNATIENVVFYKNNGAGNFGSAIHNTGHIDKIVGKFIYNASGSGAIANSTRKEKNDIPTNAIIDYIEGDFIGNHSGSHGGAILNRYGGRIEEVNNSNFILNRSASSGGAIRNLEDDNYIKIKNSIFKYNSTRQGGAIHNGGTSIAYIENSIFDSNYAYIKKDGNKNNGGGAIFTDGNTYITDCIFENNVTRDKGGAILSENVLVINAKDKDVYFENNIQGATVTVPNGGPLTKEDFTVTGGEYNDLYLRKSAQINANTGKSITFNGSVISEKFDTILDIGKSSEINGGDYIFNNVVKGGTMFLHDGANIILGSHEQKDGTVSYGNFDLQQFKTDGKASVNLQNGYTEQNSFGKLDLGSDLLVALDADLQGKKVDTFTATGVNANGHNIVINAIRLLNENLGTTEITLTDDINFKNVYRLSNEIVSNITKANDSIKGSYSVKYSDFGLWNDGTDSGLGNTKGILVFDGKIIPTLASSVHSDEEIKLYGLDKDEIVKEDLGVLHGNSLGVAGNGYAINGTTDGVQYQGIILGNNQVLSIGNVSSYNGFEVAIKNNQNGALTIFDTIFENNSTADIDNSGLMSLSGTNSFEKIIDSNKSGTMEINDGKTTIKDSIVQHTLKINSGELVNNGSAVITTGYNNGKITGSGNLSLQGDFTNNDEINLDLGVTNNAKFTNNGKVNNFTNNSNGHLITSAGNISGNITNNGTIDLLGDTLATNINGNGKTNIYSNTKIDSKILGNILTLNDNSELSLGLNGDISNANQFIVNSGSLNLQNAIASNTNLGNLVLNNDLNMKIDGDFFNKKLDTFTVNSLVNNGNHIKISNINILTPTIDKKFSISPIGSMSDSLTKQQLAQTIQYTGGDISMTPIYKYKTTYDPNNGMLNFARQGGETPTYQDFNPAVLATPVMAQVGLQTTMNSTISYAFHHADEFTKLAASDRYMALNWKKYALVETDKKNRFSSTDFNQNLSGFSNAYENEGYWIRPYAIFENIPLKHGPKVGANFYGSLVGFDSNFKSLKNGWNTIFTGYLGYNGAYLTYNNISSIMNGGLLGLTQTWYKGNFWTAITATAGASASENHTFYGNEDTLSLMGGIGSKTGYNFEFKNGKLIVQPIWFMSGNFMKTFDYTNAAGVRINSNPLFTIQLNPQIRMIANLKNGWQPYISAGMIWNIMEGNTVKANGQKLPEMSVKPYAEYGCGVQKQIGSNFTAFIQTMFHSGGHNGVAFTGGFRWAFDGFVKPKKKHDNEKVMKKTVIKMANHPSNQYSVK